MEIMLILIALCVLLWYIYRKTLKAKRVFGWSKKRKWKNSYNKYSNPNSQFSNKSVSSPSTYAERRKEFYQSPEWKSIRVDVIEKYKGQCLMCGRSSKDGVIMNVDHIIPLSKDWSKRLDINNLQLLCSKCNMGKSNRYQTDWRKRH